MSTSTDKKDVQGRSWDQITKDGTGSAASVGTGGTGDIGSMSGQTGSGGSQQNTRTDDLLASDTDQGGGAEGFQSPEGQGGLQTGMGGSGAGNRQSGSLNQQGSGGMRTTETDRDQGNSAREDQQNR